MVLMSLGMPMTYFVMSSYFRLAFVCARTSTLKLKMITQRFHVARWAIMNVYMLLNDLWLLNTETKNDLGG